MGQQININVLKQHPKNNEFFDDLNGEEFERLKNSIRDEKIYTDILVSPDMTIISGHQRVRAAKELGMTLVPIKIDDDLQDENSKLRALISNNFGRRKNDPAKDRKALETYVELKGYKHGEIGNGRKKKDHNGLSTLDEIAKDLNMSTTNLKRALRIERNLTDSMKELLDTGTITRTLAADTIASLSEDEQEELLKRLDITQKITKREVQQYIDKIKQLEFNNPKVKELENQISDLKAEKRILEKKVKLNQEESDKYNKLKNEIEFLTKQKSDLGRQIDSATELAGLTVRLQKLLEDDLAPIKFKRCMETLESSDVCVSNLEEIITKLDNWSYEMKKLLTNKCDDVVDV